MAKTRGGAGGSGWVVLAFVLGVLAAGSGGFAYLKIAGRTIATVDKPPAARHLASPPVTPHMDREKKMPPFGASEDAFESGAHIYRAHCASCHGTPSHTAALAKSTDPAAVQLWKSQGKQGTGASGHDPAETYSKIANGIHLTAMPAYKHVLSETQLWQVSLLLANAGKELPTPVTRILDGP